MDKQAAPDEVQTVEAEVIGQDTEFAQDSAAAGSEQTEEAAAAEAAPQAETPEEEDDSFDFVFPKDRPSEAVSISYDEGELAPVIAAIGKGERAEAIVEMAKELGIYIHRDPVLLNQLKQLKEGEQVPEELFTIIATILSFSYILQGKTPGIYKRADGSQAVNLKA